MASVLRGVLFAGRPRYALLHRLARLEVDGLRPLVLAVDGVIDRLDRLVGGVELVLQAHVHRLLLVAVDEELQVLLGHAVQLLLGASGGPLVQLQLPGVAVPAVEVGFLRHEPTAAVEGREVVLPDDDGRHVDLSLVGTPTYRGVTLLYIAWRRWEVNTS